MMVDGIRSTIAPCSVNLGYFRPATPYPEDTIPSSRLGPFDRPSKDEELLSEGEILSGQGRTAEQQNNEDRVSARDGGRIPRRRRQRVAAAAKV